MRHDSPAKHRDTDPTCTDAGCSVEAGGRGTSLPILNHYLQFSWGRSLDKCMTIKLRASIDKVQLGD